MRSRTCLFDDQRAARQPSVDPDGRFRRKHGSVEELVPDRQSEAEVDILRSVQLVVNSVKVRTDEDSAQRPNPRLVLE